MASPRYIAAHMLMPAFLRDQGLGPILEAIEREDADFFIPVWFRAGFRFSPILLAHSSGDFRIGVVTLPMPREMAEGYLAVFVGKHGDPSFARYFVWEQSISVMNPDEPRTVVGEWSERGHTNHGSGPPFTGDLVADCAAFVGRVLALCAPVH